MRRKIGLIGVAAALLLGACGSDHTPSAAARAAYVEAHATALCKVSDNTFQSQADQEKAFLTASTAGVSPEDERALDEQAETDAQLRADISARVKERCG